MPVNFDSSGHGAHLSLSGSGTTTWTHTVSTLATNTVALVAILWNGDVDVTSASFTVTYSSTTMTKIAGPATWLSGVGSNPKSWMALYSLASPPAGTSTVSVSWSGMSGTLLTDNLLGVSASYSGVATVDAAVTATTTTSTNNSVTVTSVAPAHRVVTVHGIGLIRAFTSSYAGSLRAQSSLLGGQLLIGDTQGSSSITETLTQLSTPQWGAFGVNLEPAVVTASALAPPIALGPALGRAGVFRHSLPPASRTWLVGVGGQYGPVDTRIGPRGWGVSSAYLDSSGQLVLQVSESTLSTPSDLSTGITIPTATDNGDGTVTLGATTSGAAPSAAVDNLNGTASITSATDNADGTITDNSGVDNNDGTVQP
jgi:hypothetical protein